MLLFFFLLLIKTFSNNKNSLIIENHFPISEITIYVVQKKFRLDFKFSCHKFIHVFDMEKSETYLNKIN